MKRSTLRKILAALTALTLLICACAPALAGDNPPGETIDNNTGTIDNNYGTITTNAESGIVTDNKGEIDTNHGTVETNNEAGNIEYNDGTVTGNKGKIEYNDTDGIIIDNEGLLETNNYIVGGDTEGGNSGTITTNNEEGCITLNTTDGTVKTNNGGIRLNEGIVNYNGEGVISENSSTGTVDLNDGCIDTNDGIVYCNDGEIFTNSGTVALNNVYICTNENDGVIALNDGYVEENCAVITTNGLEGEVYNAEDGFVTDNYGIVFNGIYDEEEGCVVYTDEDTACVSLLFVNTSGEEDLHTYTDVDYFSDSWGSFFIEGNAFVLPEPTTESKSGYRALWSYLDELGEETTGKAGDTLIIDRAMMFNLLWEKLASSAKSSGLRTSDSHGISKSNVFFFMRKPGNLKSVKVNGVALVENEDYTITAVARDEDDTDNTATQLTFTDAFFAKYGVDGIVVRVQFVDQAYKLFATNDPELIQEYTEA